MRTTGAEAAPVTFEQNCTGAEEVPAVSGPGSALARLTFDDETNVLTYQVTVHGISGGAVTASHIHQAAAGSNGPVIIALSLEPFTSVHGSATLDDDQVEALMAGDYYINVHSSNNPGGFARCQLNVPVVAVVTPPSTGDGGLAASGSTFWPAAAVLAALLVSISGAALAVVATRRRI